MEEVPMDYRRQQQQQWKNGNGIELINRAMK
jgi:hypothetical protein